jgi:hypothetical protein
MAATPFEHDELAVATKWTGEVTVAPFPGLVTLTPANADEANANRHTNRLSFPTVIPKISSEKFRDRLQQSAAKL